MNIKDIFKSSFLKEYFKKTYLKEIYNWILASKTDALRVL